MHKSLVVLAYIAISAVSVSPSFGADFHQNDSVRPTADQLQFVFPGNIDCRDFERSSSTVWRLRDRSSVDLGNWDGSFWVGGAISRGVFVRNGFDLLTILEAKCGKSA